ncbi:MAG: hypothetical protein KIT00_04520, partial [Rhodospirillales bacterium]|nr:hypothetical protein [Rhodospirillales bacterium]
MVQTTRPAQSSGRTPDTMGSHPSEAAHPKVDQSLGSKSADAKFLAMDREFYLTTVVATGLSVAMLIMAWSPMLVAMASLEEIMASIHSSTGSLNGTLPTITTGQFWFAVAAVAAMLMLSVTVFAFPPIVLGHDLARMIGLGRKSLWGIYKPVNDQETIKEYLARIEPRLKVDRVWYALTGDGETAVLHRSILLNIEDYLIIRKETSPKRKQSRLQEWSNRERESVHFTIHHEFYHVYCSESRFFRLFSGLAFACS